MLHNSLVLSKNSVDPKSNISLSTRERFTIENIDQTLWFQHQNFLPIENEKYPKNANKWFRSRETQFDDSYSVILLLVYLVYSLIPQLKVPPVSGLTTCYYRVFHPYRKGTRVLQFSVNKLKMIMGVSRNLSDV